MSPRTTAILERYNRKVSQGGSAPNQNSGLNVSDIPMVTPSVTNITGQSDTRVTPSSILFPSTSAASTLLSLQPTATPDSAAHTSRDAAKVVGSTSGTLSAIEAITVRHTQKLIQYTPGSALSVGKTPSLADTTQSSAKDPSADKRPAGTHGDWRDDSSLKPQIDLLSRATDVDAQVREQQLKSTEQALSEEVAKIRRNYYQYTQHVKADSPPPKPPAVELVPSATVPRAARQDASAEAMDHSVTISALPKPAAPQTNIARSAQSPASSVQFPGWYVRTQQSSDLVSPLTLGAKYVACTEVPSSAILQEGILVRDCIAILAGSFETELLVLSRETLQVAPRPSVVNKLQAPLLALATRITATAGDRHGIASFVHSHQFPAYGAIGNALGHSLRDVLIEYDFFLAGLYAQATEAHGKARLTVTLQVLDMKVRQILDVLSTLERFIARLGEARGCETVKILEGFIAELSGTHVQKILQHILKVTTAPLVDALSQWLTHGFLTEDDFFVTLNEEFTAPQGLAALPVLDSHSSVCGREDEWLRKYSLRTQDIPQFLYPIKGQILEVGKCKDMLLRLVAMFRSVHTMHSPDCDAFHSGSVLGSYCALEGSAAPGAGVSTSTSASAQVDTLAVTPGELGRLMSDYSGSALLYRKVDDMAARVARDLFDAFVDPRILGFRQHLRTLLSFFLLQSGDTLSLFIDYAIADLEVPSTRCNILRLRNQFALAVKTSSTAKDPNADRVSIGIAEYSCIASINRVLFPDAFDEQEVRARMQKERPRKTLQMLDLSYAVAWPLNIVLSAESMARAKILFRWLLRLRVVEIELHKAWTCLMDLQNIDNAHRRAAATRGQAAPPQAFLPRASSQPIHTVFGIAFKTLCSMLKFAKDMEFRFLALIEASIREFDVAYQAMLHSPRRTLDGLVAAMGRFTGSLVDGFGLGCERSVLAVEKLFSDCMVFAHTILIKYAVSPEIVDDDIDRDRRAGRRMRTALRRREREDLRTEQLLLLKESLEGQLKHDSAAFRLLHESFFRTLGAYEELAAAPV